jgi:hypothetical protein
MIILRLGGKAVERESLSRRLFNSCHAVEIYDVWRNADSRNHMWKHWRTA